MGLDPALEPEASAFTESGAEPELGVIASPAVGGRATTTERVAVADIPTLSLTVSVTV
jgi:hypothetical protein